VDDKKTGLMGKKNYKKKGKKNIARLISKNREGELGTVETERVGGGGGGDGGKNTISRQLLLGIVGEKR